MALLVRMLRGRVGLTAASLMLSLLAMAAMLWWNSLLSAFIDGISTGIAPAGRAILTAAAAIALNAVCAWSRGMVSSWTCESLTHELRMGYARHFAALSLPEIEGIGAGEQLSRLQNEIVDISGFLSNHLFALADDAVRFAATFSWMLWLDPRLTLLCHIPVVFILAYTVYSSRTIGEAARQSQQANGHMGGFTDTLVSVFPIVRLFEAAPLLLDRYGEAVSRWQTCRIREERTRARLMSLSALLSCLPLLALFGAGGIQVIRGDITLGTLYIFINLSGYVSGALMNMPGRVAAFRRFAANLERMAPHVDLDEGRRRHGHPGRGSALFIR